MANTPTSFRFPYETELAGQHEGVQNALRGTFQAILDVHQAVIALNDKVGSTSTTTTTTGTSSGSTAANFVTQLNTYLPSSIYSVLGNVNVQTAAYTVQSSDYGGVVVMNAGSPVAVTLNPLLNIRWFGSVLNLSTSSVTLTPGVGSSPAGTINNQVTLSLGQNEGAIIYYDGTNWWAILSETGGVKQIVAGTNITISPPGGTGVVTINASGSGVSSLNSLTGALSIVAGTNITVTPNSPSPGDIKIDATGASGYLKGSIAFNVTSTTGTFFGSTNIPGVTTGMCAVIMFDTIINGVTEITYTMKVDVSTSGSGFPPGDNVFGVMTVSGLGSTGTITLPVVVFP